MSEIEQQFFGEQIKLAEESEVEGTTFSFDDPDEGKSTDLNIQKIKEVIGRGSYSSWVAKVDVALPNSPDRPHSMVLKKYRAEELAIVRQSYNNYKRLRKIGVPTWDTYRINETEGMALMTLATKDNEFFITPTDNMSRNEELFSKNPIKTIENLDVFIEKMQLMMSKIIENRLRIRPDSLGVVFTPNNDVNGSYKVDILVADLDNLDDMNETVKEYGERDFQTTKYDNLLFLESSLKNIFPYDFWKEGEIIEELVLRVKDKLPEHL